MLGMDLDLSEEDQMMRAIAMSLGENVTMSSADKEPEKKQEEDESKKKEEEKNAEKDKQIPEEPLSKEVIDQFTETMMQGENSSKVTELSLGLFHLKRWGGGRLEKISDPPPPARPFQICRPPPPPRPFRIY